ncbi:SAM-dependent methyltransferase [Streptomyces sp. NPDC002793]|uniref:SAM-dependent methyltransferase n=1 Tax=Streptomyces sp. NPDC002793 TaxID=3154432 RepID=UPI003321F7BB
MSRPENDATTPRIDTSRPHPARMYDWFLGGKDNYPVDEALGRQMLAVEPSVPVMAKVNRAFMHRATRWLTGQGIRQFLDIGTGIPTEPNLHQVAQQAAPSARVVYCDNDPIVLAHAEALLKGSPEGAIDYVQADAREVDAILEHAGKTLDFGQPVALSLISLLHFVSDEDGAYELVERLTEVLAPGSHVVISHLTADFHPAEAGKVNEMYKANTLTLAPRTHDQFARFFDGLDVVEPGIVAAEAWHPGLGEPIPGQDDIVSAGYVAVGRKP